MNVRRVGLFACLGLVVAVPGVRATEPDPEPAPWNYVSSTPCCGPKSRVTPPMFGDLFAFGGFNFGGGGFQGGAQGGFQGGFQGGAQGGFQGGFQGGAQGGFQGGAQG